MIKEKEDYIQDPGVDQKLKDNKVFLFKTFHSLLMESARQNMVQEG